jgi:hypothetical protein
MSKPATHPERGRTINAHIEWWADHVERRMLGNVRHAKGHNSGRPKEVWNRAQFLRYIWAKAPDYPGEELADKFEQALAAARGNPARFRRQVERLLG